METKSDDLGAETSNPLLTDQAFNSKNVMISVIGGGLAGISVDFALFPIDSIKTRLQASTNKVDYTKQAASVSKYKGFLSAMLASFPCAAVFWCTYECCKYNLRSDQSALSFNQQNMLAASVAECAQALIRNPSEVIKQNL